MRAFIVLCALLMIAPTCALADGDDKGPPIGSSSTGPAPADEYFGRLKMSILGIRNQLIHLTKQADENAGDGDDIIATASLTEESVKEWERHYPRDPWLDRTVYMLVHLYARIPGEAGHASAVRTISWLISKYPTSKFTETAVQEVGRSSPDQ